MRLAVFALVVGACAHAGPASPDLALEARVAALEQQLAALQSRVTTLRANSNTANQGASQEEEEAAATLLKAAQDAFDELDVPLARARLRELREKYTNTRTYRAARRIEAELAVVGKPEAELQVERWYVGDASSLEGATTTVHVFWEVWCPHCKREVPKLVSLQDRFRERGLRVVGLTKQTRDVTDEQVEAFVRDAGITYPIARELGSEMSDHYSVRGIPAAAVTRGGTVIWRGHPALLSDELIERLLTD